MVRRPAVLAGSLVAQLRRAMDHCEGASQRGGADSREMIAMGVASQSVATVLAETVLSMLPVIR